MGDDIFINYRRVDSGLTAANIFAALQRAFPRRSIFMDIDTVRPGENFQQAIAQALSTSGTVLVLIGPGWFAPGPNGHPRLFEAGDYVRMEIAAALSSSARVIPVLLNGTGMPTAQMLPDDIRTLATRQARHLRASDLGSDMDGLMRSIGTAKRAGAWKIWAPLVGLGVLALGAAAYGLGERFQEDPAEAQREVNSPSDPMSDRPAESLSPAVAKPSLDAAGPSSAADNGPNATAEPSTAESQTESPVQGDDQNEARESEPEGKTVVTRRLEREISIEKHSFRDTHTVDATLDGYEEPIEGTVEIDYPFLRGHPDRRIQTQVNELLRKTSQAGSNFEELTDFEGTYSVLSFEYNLLSVRFDASSYAIGAAHSMSEQYVVNVDVATGRVIKLTDIFKDEIGQHWTTAVMSKSKCIEEIPAWNPEQSYYIKGNTLILIYDIYEVCAYVEGQPEIHLDIMTLRPYLEPEGLLNYFL